VLVHPGAAAYLGDNTKSFFDKYGDTIFYGLLIFPIIGSAIAGVLSYFRADKNTQRIRQLHRLLHLIKRARTVQSIDELEGYRTKPTSSWGRRSSKPSAANSTRAASPFSPLRSIRRAPRCPNSARCCC
jgi:hypothetical protein